MLRLHGSTASVLYAADNLSDGRMQISLGQWRLYNAIKLDEIVQSSVELILSNGRQLMS